jgi:hypothetical protein
MLLSFRERGLRGAALRAASGALVLGALSGTIVLAAIPDRPVPVNVRWTAAVSDAQREALEERFHLEEPRFTEGTTRAYMLTDVSRENIRALLQHAAVEDTSNLNRVRFRPPFRYDRIRLAIAALILGGLIGGVAGLISPAAIAITRTPVHLRVGLFPAVPVAARALLAVAVFVFSWLLRFNDPSGSFAGLTDDHFFYLIRGWQILFGDLPVRDFVDHGAPLFYYVGYSVQELFGRGTLSELMFTTTVVAFCASLTFLLAADAAGSTIVGLVAVLFQILLEPRFYNYPKILVYAVAIPLIWRYATAPSTRRIAWVAVVAVIGFLFRHDHGLFVGIATAVVLAAMTDIPLKDRIRHGRAFLIVCVIALAPYLAFIQVNGGVVSYFRQASAWAERDRDRAPVVWPGLGDNPDGVSDAARQGSGLTKVVATIRDNSVAWLFYLEIVLPLVALALLAVSPSAFRPRWPRARVKLLSVAVLAVVLDVGFLRSPLGARLADPSVPLVILIAWLMVAVPRLMAAPGEIDVRAQRWVWPLRIATAVVVLPIAFILGATLSANADRGLRKSDLMVDGHPLERVNSVSAQVSSDWRLESWLERPDRAELIDLAFYLNACTMPTDRVLVEAYIPQVLALSRRAFAGGHADLRPGFFSTRDAQELTIARLKAQSVPVIVLDDGQSYRNFRESFPLVTAYLDANYRVAGTHTFERYGTTLLVRKDREPNGVYEPLGWPCYGSGRVQSE